MNSEVSASATSSTPQIVVTEPSPVSVPTQSSVSVARKMESIPEVTQQSVPQTTCGIAGVPESSKMPLVQASPVAPLSQSSSGESASTARNQPPPSYSSGEFTAAPDSNVRPEPRVELLQSVEGGTATSESNRPIPHDFMPGGGRWLICILACFWRYEKVWRIIHRGYAILLWVILSSLPMSGGVMGALYMTSCPAYLVVTTLMFLIGLIQTAGMSLRVCLIIHLRVGHEGNGRQMLRHLLLVSTFLTVVLFIAESVVFWKMTPSPDNYLELCGDLFPTFAFWWNCIMSAVIVPLIIFPL